MKSNIQKIIIYCIACMAIIISSILMLSCNKNAEPKIEEVSQNLNIEQYAKKMMTDGAFINLVKNYSTALYDVKILVKSDNNKPNGVSTTNISLVEAHSEEMTLAIAKYVCENKSFVTLSNSNRIQVLEYVRTAIISPEFRNNNPVLVAPLLKVNEELNNHINSISTEHLYSNYYVNSLRVVKINRVTSNELIGCALGALAGAIGSYGDAIDDIRYIMTQGWSGTALINAALSIIKNASPWWKVASVAIGFGACVWGVAD